MKSIQKLRLEIENLHQDLLHFILKRKDLVDQIWQLKKAHQMDLTDANREQALIEQFDQHPKLAQDPALKDFYHHVVKNIIAENKKYAKKD